MLKGRICKQYAQSKNARLRTLLQDLQLRDQRLTHLLHQMQILAENKISEEVLKQLWLQRLPIHMQQILSISKDKLSDL